MHVISSWSNGLLSVALVVFHRISAIIIHQIFSLARDWSKHVTWPNIPQLKLGNIWEYSPIFKTVHIAKKIWRIINTIASIWGENMLVYLSVDISCSSKLTVAVLFPEQIMSTDKYPSIFSIQTEAIIYLYHTQAKIFDGSQFMLSENWSLLGTDNVSGQIS